MAFREKIAWLTLVTMLAAYAVYFSTVEWFVGDSPMAVVRMLMLFGGVTITQAIVVIVGTTIIAVTGPAEANAPADERDRAISRRAGNIAYHILTVGMIVVGVVMPFQYQGLVIVNAALFALVVAMTTHDGLVIASYRRGWHG